MYEIQFVATSSAGWAEAIQLINDETNLPFVIEPGDTIELEVRGRGGGVLEASTANGKIEHPEPSIIQWRFTPAEITAFCKDRTYRVGCVLTNSAGPTQLFIGTLSLLDGEVT